MLDPALEAQLYPAGFAAPSRHSTLRRRHRGAARQAVGPVQERRHPDSPRPGRHSVTRWLSGGPCSALNSKGEVALLEQPPDTRRAAAGRWIVESHERCTTVRETAAPRESADRDRGGGPPDGGVTGLSYERLLPYRDVLMRALFSKIADRRREPAGVCGVRPQPEARAGPARCWIRTTSSRPSCATCC